MRREHVIEPAEQVQLELLDLGGRLDHQVAVAQQLQILNQLDPLEHLFDLHFGGPAGAHRPCQ